MESNLKSDIYRNQTSENSKGKLFMINKDSIITTSTKTNSNILSVSDSYFYLRKSYLLNLFDNKFLIMVNNFIVTLKLNDKYYEDLLKVCKTTLLSPIELSLLYLFVEKFDKEKLSKEVLICIALEAKANINSDESDAVYSYIIQKHPLIKTEFENIQKMMIKNVLPSEIFIVYDNLSKNNKKANFNKEELTYVNYNSLVKEIVTLSHPHSKNLIRELEYKTSQKPKAKYDIITTLNKLEPINGNKFAKNNDLFKKPSTFESIIENLKKFSKTSLQNNNFLCKKRQGSS